ncbi:MULTISPECIES: GntR family transcriptional regulator [unclassified Streptomyces]|uniref:GntR family transcriptional regulator n=1 Tax=unclassified Streptomyces TaxID=2593676 RepID=UPI00380B78FA
MATDRPGADRRETPKAGTRWAEIADVLRSRINDNTYERGRNLPTQQRLAEEFGVSRETVVRALKALKSEGWIETLQGSGTKVAQEPQEAVVRSRRIHMAAPESGRPVGLGELIAKAFRSARDVTLDAYSLTTESLAHHLAVQLDAVERGEVRPDSITLRLLVPSQEFRPAYPAAVPEPGAPLDPAEDRPYQRWMNMANVHIDGLRTRLETLVAEPAVTTAFRLSVRQVPLTPTNKIYIFNGESSLSGLYHVTRRDMILDDGSTVDALDVLGRLSTLFHHRKTDDPKAEGSLQVAELGAWFESVWTHLGVTQVEWPPRET